MAKQTSSVQNVNDKPDFGSRFLTADADVWSQNAWDHVEPPSERLEYVEESLRRQRSAPVPLEEQRKYNERPWRHWDSFYKTNTNNFFKNRKWLHLEFPEILEAAQKNYGKARILEVGCGAGNAVFPILEANENDGLELIACDYSHRAVNLVTSNSLYSSDHVGSIRAAVWDLTSDSLPENLEEESVDIILMIFVLSALHPIEWSRAISNVYKLLKPGGKVLLRDYGRHDLTQVRFKEKRLLQENFYIRGDNTRVYFFDLDDLAQIFTGQPLPARMRVDVREIEELQTELVDSTSSLGQDLPTSPQEGIVGTPNDVPGPSGPTILADRFPSKVPETPSPLRFEIEQIGVDRRLLVNRKRQLKMYRVWMQAKFSKPFS